MYLQKGLYSFTSHWHDVWECLCHFMVIFVEFPPKATTTGWCFQASELCCHWLRQDIPTAPKTSAIPAKAITCCCPKVKLKGSLFKVCKNPFWFRNMVLGGTWRLLCSNTSVWHEHATYCFSQRDHKWSRSQNLGYSIPGSLSSAVT